MAKEHGQHGKAVARHGERGGKAAKQAPTDGRAVAPEPAVRGATAQAAAADPPVAAGGPAALAAPHAAPLAAAPTEGDWPVETAGPGGHAHEARPPMSTKEYERELARLQVELVKLQEWVRAEGRKIVVLFEGRDAAGKGGVIKRITEPLNPRYCRVAALAAPTERERTQWYFQRYVAHLPAAGEIVLFDRSWYNRAGVERVMGFCTDEEYREFLRSCPEFERMLMRSGITLLKYWFSVSDEEQERRFQDRIADPTKRWKLSPMDLESRARWVEYSRAKDEMFASTDLKQSPWWVVPSDDKKRARLNCIRHLLSSIPYHDLTPEPMKLPPRQADGGYVRPPMTDQTFVPQVY